MYTLVFAPQAIEDLSKLKKSEPAAFKKAGKLLTELQEHPKTGTGKPEPLSGDRAGQWSRCKKQIYFPQFSEKRVSPLFGSLMGRLLE